MLTQRSGYVTSTPSTHWTGIIIIFQHNPTGIYLLKVNNRNTRTRYEICSKLTIKTPERRHLVSLLITLNIFHTMF